MFFIRNILRPYWVNGFQMALVRQHTNAPIWSGGDIQSAAAVAMDLWSSNVLLVIYMVLPHRHATPAADCPAPPVLCPCVCMCEPLRQTIDGWVLFSGTQQPPHTHTHIATTTACAFRAEHRHGALVTRCLCARERVRAG